MDTKAVNGPAYIKKQTGEEVTDFQNGVQVIIIHSPVVPVFRPEIFQVVDI